MHIKILLTVKQLKWLYSRISRDSDGHEFVPSLVTVVNILGGNRKEAPRVKPGFPAGAYAALHILSLFYMSLISFYGLTA